jgi:hypothetical protein
MPIRWRHFISRAMAAELTIQKSGGTPLVC